MRPDDPQTSPQEVPVTPDLLELFPDFTTESKDGKDRFVLQSSASTAAIKLNEAIESYWTAKPFCRETAKLFHSNFLHAKVTEHNTTIQWFLTEGRQIFNWGEDEPKNGEWPARLRNLLNSSDLVSDNIAVHRFHYSLPARAH